MRLVPHIVATQLQENCAPLRTWSIRVFQKHTNSYKKTMLNYLHGHSSFSQAHKLYDKITFTF